MNDDSNLLEWQRLAEMDLATAHHMFETYLPRPIEIVCFHSQQAAEKMLKCFLLSNGIEAPKTHDLQLLLEMCLEIKKGFNDVYKEAALLTRYGVLPRYPAELGLTPQDAQTAIKYADNVVNYIKSIMG